jgi:hypothetical protein
MQQAAALDGNGEQGDTYFFWVSLMATPAKRSATAPPTIARMPDIAGCRRSMCVLDLLSRGIRRSKIRRLENER